MHNSTTQEPQDMYRPTQAWTLLLLRLSMVPLFCYSGFGKLFNIAGTADRLPGGHEGLGFMLALGATGLELAGAIALTLGVFARPFAVAFIPYIVVASLMFHSFWAAPPEMVMAQTLNFLKNVGLIGGMAIIAAFGAGPFRVTFRGSALKETMPR